MNYNIINVSTEEDIYLFISWASDFSSVDALSMNSEGLEIIKRGHLIWFTLSCTVRLYTDYQALFSR